MNFSEPQWHGSRQAIQKWGGCSQIGGLGETFLPPRPRPLPIRLISIVMQFAVRPIERVPEQIRQSAAPECVISQLPSAALAYVLRSVHFKCEISHTPLPINDLWVRKCVKSRTFLLRRRASSPSPSERRVNHTHTQKFPQLSIQTRTSKRRCNFSKRHQIDR